MEQIGFKTFIYNNFTVKRWESGQGQRPIYVGVKNAMTDKERFI
jgi:hypothetical protein